MISIDDAYGEFAIRRFPLPSEEQVAKLERELAIQFPPDFRRYLLEFNGGYFSEPKIEAGDFEAKGDGLTCLHGINSGHWDSELAAPHLLDLFEGNDPRIVLPVGHTCGGLIILSTGDEGRGEIHLKKAFDGFYYLANGIEEFFGLLRE
jgi:hypothetical protein